MLVCQQFRVNSPCSFVNNSGTSEEFLRFVLLGVRPLSCTRLPGPGRPKRPKRTKKYGTSEEFLRFVLLGVQSFRALG